MAIAPERKNLWTVEEADRLAEAGLICGRYEVIEGEIIEKMPAEPPHIFTLQLLAIWLNHLFGERFVRQQLPMLLPGLHNRPEPDVAVTGRPLTAYRRRLPAPEDMVLVAEVSDSTLRLDMNTKAALYARVGVREYWVMDVQARRIVVHRQPGAQGYADIREYGETEQIAPESRPEALVTVAALFDEEEDGE